MRNRQPLHFSTLFFCVLLAPGALRSDTVHLKNGYRINGKVDSQASSDTEYVVRIGDSGLIRLARDRVDRIEQNSLDTVSSESPGASAVPAAGGEMVTVTLRDSTFFGSRLHKERPGPVPPGLVAGEADPRARGGISGIRVPTTDQKHYVLRIPGAGTLRLPRELIEREEPYRPPSGDLAPVAAREGVIPTTHLVYLKNGKRLQGNIVPGEQSAPLILELGSLGRLFIDRSTIAKIEAVRGEYKLPPPAPAEPQVPVGPPPAQESRKEEKATEAQPEVGMLEVSPEERAQIMMLLYELTRQRSQNRVRAENALRRLGAKAIPFLDLVRDHPFNLTRRAVMRLVRDARSMEGLPFAIDAMTDPDSFVREHASEALDVLTDGDVSFQPNASPAARRRAQKQLLDRYGLSMADSAK